MSRGSEELTNARKEEILDAFEKLYQTKSVRSISMREIGEKTSLTRSSIYNYFQTKEEIQLELTIREFAAWRDELRKISVHESMTKQEFAEAIANSLAERKQFIKLISWNHCEIEENSRPERLAQMQKVTYDAMRLFILCLGKSFSDMPDDEKQGLMLDFFTYLYGIDCFIQVSPGQQKALKLTDIPYNPISIHDSVYGFLLRHFRQEDKK